jgi:hypothetical protein
VNRLITEWGTVSRYYHRYQAHQGGLVFANRRLVEDILKRQDFLSLKIKLLIRALQTAEAALTGTKRTMPRLLATPGWPIPGRRTAITPSRGIMIFCVIIRVERIPLTLRPPHSVHCAAGGTEGLYHPSPRPGNPHSQLHHCLHLAFGPTSSARFYKVFLVCHDASGFGYRDSDSTTPSRKLLTD